MTTIYNRNNYLTSSKSSVNSLNVLNNATIGDSSSDLLNVSSTATFNVIPVISSSNTETITDPKKLITKSYVDTNCINKISYGVSAYTDTLKDASGNITSYRLNVPDCKSTTPVSATVNANVNAANQVVFYLNAPSIQSGYTDISAKAVMINFDYYIQQCSAIVSNNTTFSQYTATQPTPFTDDQFIVSESGSNSTSYTTTFSIQIGSDKKYVKQIAANANIWSNYSATNGVAKELANAITYNSQSVRFYAIQFIKMSNTQIKIVVCFPTFFNDMRNAGWISNMGFTCSITGGFNTSNNSGWTISN